MIDLLFLAHNRLEFTKASLAALEANTNWSHVGHFHIYDDDSQDGTREYIREWSDARPHLPITRHFGSYGHPVNVMRDYIKGFWRHSIFGKIDSDTMVPPGWLDACLDVMDRHEELDLLGIEVFNAVSTDTKERGYTDASFIGGIGLMRIRSFHKHDLPEPFGRYFGFTEWQERHPEIKKGWINPSLPVFLLDRFPGEPWRSLSKSYVAKFGQRDWGPYDETSTDLWSWWEGSK
jgi:GT2 family glycosyltransferase